MEYLDKLQIANTGDFCKAIRYFSGFSIPLILTITDILLSKNWAIWITVGLFLFAILCSIVGHVLSDYGIDKRREYTGLFWIYQKREYRTKWFTRYVELYFRYLSHKRLTCISVVVAASSSTHTGTCVHSTNTPHR